MLTAMLTAMRFADLRKRCEARLRELVIESPFDLGTFCRSVERRRGRPIHLVPVLNPLGPCGLWAAAPSADYIFYEQDTSALHQHQIILHEISHLLWSHRALPLTETALAALLFPDLRAGTVQRVLRRVAYSTDEEQEAELLASLLMERISGHGSGSPRPTPSVDPTAEASLRRLETVLEQGAAEE